LGLVFYFKQRLNIKSGQVEQMCTCGILLVFSCISQREGIAVQLRDDEEQWVVSEPFVMTGDHNVNDDSRAVIHAIKAVRPVLVIHAGDLAYDKMNGGTSWEDWTSMITSLAGRYFPVFGNHDSRENVVPFFAQFSDEFKNVNGATTFDLTHFPFCYSFDFDGIHFMGLDTEEHVSDFVQRQWAHDDLEAARLRKSVKFTVVYMHRPMYASCHHRAEGVDSALPWAAKLFDQFGVDLGLYGHSHYYERTYPMFRNLPTSSNQTHYTRPNGTIHIVSGTGGYEQFAEDYSEPSWTMACADNRWSNHRFFQQFGFLQFNISSNGKGDARLCGAFIPTGAGRAHGRDSFCITK
jgi:hypothetical protein